MGTAGPSADATSGVSGADRAIRVFQSRAPYWWATISSASLWLMSTSRAARSPRSRVAICLWVSDMTLLLAGGPPLVRCVRGLRCLGRVRPVRAHHGQDVHGWAFTVPVIRVQA